MFINAVYTFMVKPFSLLFPSIVTRTQKTHGYC